MQRALPVSPHAAAIWTAFAGLCIVTTTFVVDLILPRGYAGAMPYVIAVALGLWAPSRAYTVVVAAAGTLLGALAPLLEIGEVVPTYVWILNRTVAIVAIWAVAFAIVRYKAFARYAADEQRKTQVILDTTVDGMISIDARGAILLFNRAAERIFGWSADEVLGKNVSVLMPPPHREHHDGYLARYLETGERRIIGFGREVEGLRKDGTSVPLDLAVAEVQLDDRKLFTASVRDITRRKRIEREREELIDKLEGKNTELERFTYTVSHDLKSPIVTIKGFLGTLERSARQGNLERLQTDVARIAAAADRMRQLLDELLELSRIGRVASPFVDVSLAELAREAAEAVSGAAEQRGVRIEVASDLPVVHGDRVRLLEVLQNLLENAIKFMGDQPAPRVEVGVRRDAGTPVYYVRDNGIGVEPRYRDKIFGLFEKLDKRAAGTGVGLALVKRIVEVHRGRTWVESDGIGRGACFCFTLGDAPLAHSERAAE